MNQKTNDVTQEDVIQALTAMGEDPSASRVEAVHRLVGGKDLPAGKREEVIRQAVESARQEMGMLAQLSEVPDPEGMNSERPSWAREALATFKAETRCDEEDAVADLLTNLMHHCDRAGLDFIVEMGRAVRHYEQETSCQFESAGLGSLDSLVSDAHELRDMKIEINGDYSADDLRRWNDRIVLAEKTVELLKSVPLYAHLEQRAQDLLASEAAAPAVDGGAQGALVSPRTDIERIQSDPASSPAASPDL
ncbi:hypothetical protein [Ralstonia sp. ASV6]|uniref:hypothetical protein n=1 Tax=Ralstonia sp. ASV6 TaxID=2795124 RepID=UPI0018EAD6A3|nr:hypothetical protein [Ralstonia sp. ASV6]